MTHLANIAITAQIYGDDAISEENAWVNNAASPGIFTQVLLNIGNNPITFPNGSSSTAIYLFVDPAPSNAGALFTLRTATNATGGERGVDFSSVNPSLIPLCNNDTVDLNGHAVANVVIITTAQTFLPIGWV